MPGFRGLFFWEPVERIIKSEKPAHTQGTRVVLGFAKLSL